MLLPMILGVFIVIVVGFPLLTFAFFWYETANGPHLQYLSNASGGRVGLWLARGILWGALSTTLAILCYPLALIRSLWRPKPDAESPRPTVILVHGLYHNASAWLVFRRRLRRAGFTNVYAISYSSWVTSFDKTLSKLERSVSEISGNLPGKQLVLIGHSLGGLLSRAYEQSPQRPDNLAALITLGAPHHGSKLAVLGLGALAQSLRYNGPLFEKLEQSGPSLACPRFALYSPMDSMVLPFDALRAPSGGWQEIETPPVGHVSMLFSKSIFRKVLELLANVPSDRTVRP